MLIIPGGALIGGLDPDRAQTGRSHILVVVRTPKWMS